MAEFLIYFRVWPGFPEGFDVARFDAIRDHAELIHAIKQYRGDYTKPTGGARFTARPNPARIFEEQPGPCIWCARCNGDVAARILVDRLNRDVQFEPEGSPVRLLRPHFVWVPAESMGHEKRVHARIDIDRFHKEEPPVENRQYALAIREWVVRITDAFLNGFGPESHPAPDETKSHNNVPVGHENSFLSCSDLAEKFGINPSTLKKHLRNYRNANPDEGWREVENRKSTEPSYLYRVGSIWDSIKHLQK